MFNAILWIARSGAAWHDLSKERYGSWKTVYSRFCLWRDTGLLESLFMALNYETDYENFDDFWSRNFLFNGNYRTR